MAIFDWDWCRNSTPREMQEIPWLRVISFAGEIPKNHDILREAYSLCYRLPVLNTDKFKEDFFNVSILQTQQCQPNHSILYKDFERKHLSCFDIRNFSDTFYSIYDVV